jgi:hypothetical protein
MSNTKTCAECGDQFTGRRHSIYCSKACYFWGHVDRTPGHGPNGDCWPWTGGINPVSGYGQTERESCGGKTRRAHRHAYTLANGDPGEMNVLHRCDVRHCCNPGHLFLGTAYDNWADAIGKGRMVIAVPKLTADEVLAIRRSSATVRELARQHQVVAPTIRAIIQGRTWRHLSDDVPMAAE